MPDTAMFGAWTPDEPDRQNGSTEAKGVIAVGRQAYAPFKSFVPYNSTLAASTGVMLGARGVYTSAGDGVIFFGDATKLYWLVSRVATDISKSGGYSVSTDRAWVFAQLGDYVVAVAENNAPQVYQLGVSSLFANLGGSPPQFTTIARVGQFLMGGLGAYVKWSAFNNPASWTISAATQCGEQSLDQAGGAVRAIVGGEYATIFQERQIRRAVYIGPPVIWDFGQDPIESRRGTLSAYSATSYGRNVFYASDDGFYVFDGSQSVPIGEGRVDDYFARNLNYSYRHKVCVGVDAQRKLVVFGFPTGSATQISELLIYSVTTGRWTHDVMDMELIFDLPVDPLTVDNFQTYEPSDNLDTPNLDGINIDSNVFDDRRRLLAGTNTSHQVGTFTGANRAATIDTREFEPAPGKRALITEVWPIVDAQPEAMSAAIGYRRALPGATIAFTNATAVNRVGFCPQRIDARFARARLQIAPGAVWSRAEGVHYTGVLTGGR